MERGKGREREFFYTAWLPLLKPREAEHAMDQGRLSEAWSSVHQCWRSLCSSKKESSFKNTTILSETTHFPLEIIPNSIWLQTHMDHILYSAISTSRPFHDLLTHFTPSINHHLATTPNQNRVWNWVPTRTPSQVRSILLEWRIEW